MPFPLGHAHQQEQPVAVFALAQTVIVVKIIGVFLSAFAVQGVNGENGYGHPVLSAGVLQSGRYVVRFIAAEQTLVVVQQFPTVSKGGAGQAQQEAEDKNEKNEFSFHTAPPTSAQAT